MTTGETFEDLFKPEVRRKGTELLKKSSIILSSMSDTKISCLVRGFSPIRISFSTDSIASPMFSVNCSCPLSAKKQLCSHAWAALLLVETHYPDFFDSKTELIVNATETAPHSSEHDQTKHIFFKQQYVEKQKIYRKQLLQKRKDQRLAEKQSQRTLGQAKRPENIQAALDFFVKNGFAELETEANLNLENLRAAKKLLSRVFHPDKGGSHNEMLLLNQNCDLLIEYIQSL